MPVSLERYLTSVLQSTSSTSRSWMGAFSPWKHLNGVGRIGSFSLHSSKVCQEFNGVLSSVNLYRGSNVSTTRKYSDSNWQHHSSPRRTTMCLEMRHLVMSSFDFKSFPHYFRSVPRGMVEPIETRTEKNPKHRIHNGRIYTVAWLLFWIAKIFSIVSTPCRVKEIFHVFSKSNNISGWWAMLSALKLFVWHIVISLHIL